MEQAGHTCAGHCEIDRFANISYNAIHQPKEGEWFASDIRAVEPGQLPDADCWCAGFPCQAFSIAGKRAGFEDMRGTIIFEIFRLAKQRKPRILLLENVAGLLSHDEGRTMATILCGFWELGYNVQWQVLNSKNFGVPQNRERIFFVGHLGAGSSPKVFPIGESNRTAAIIPGQIANTVTSRTGGAASTGCFLVENKQPAQSIKCVGNLMPSGNKNNSVPGRVYDIGGLSPCLRTPTGGMTTPIIIDDIYRNRDPREYGSYAPCIRAQKCNDLKVSDGITIRKLTPRETFRLQGFPDWAFDRAQGAGVSDSQLYKQAGNSVTVPVVYEIARRLE